MSSFVFFFQAEDGIRDLVRSRGLGDVYKRQRQNRYSRYKWKARANGHGYILAGDAVGIGCQQGEALSSRLGNVTTCLLYTSDAADDLLCVDLGGRRIIKKKKYIKKLKKTSRSR